MVLQNAFENFREFLLLFRISIEIDRKINTQTKKMWTLVEKRVWSKYDLFRPFHGSFFFYVVHTHTNTHQKPSVFILLERASSNSGYFFVTYQQLTLTVAFKRWRFVRINFVPKSSKFLIDFCISHENLEKNLAQQLKRFTIMPFNVVSGFSRKVLWALTVDIFRNCGQA